jgi:tetraacyldisaccharide 4'-kinase
VATLSRGYKRKTQGFLLANETTNTLQIGDEPMQYHMKYRDVAVSVAEDRMTGIPMLLLHKPEVEVVLLDDAYQHRSVKPGINILITDFSKPYFEDYILPYGMLREGRKAAHRADVIIVSKCPLHLTKENANNFIHKMEPLHHQQIFFTGIHYGEAYELFTQETISLKGKKIVLVCCIAKPESLLQYLSQEAQQVHPLTYPDHHYFTSNNLEEIKAAYDNWEVPNKIIVTTEKDATRLNLHKEQLQQWNLSVMVLPIEVNFLFEEGTQFDERISRYVDEMIQENREPQQSESHLLMQH